MGLNQFVEELQVFGHEMAAKVRELIHEGNVRRIIVKDENGNTFLEIPVTIAAVGAIAAPVVAAVGAIAAMAAKFKIVVERTSHEADAASAAGSGSQSSTGPNL